MAHPVIHHTKRILNKPHLVVPGAIILALIIGIIGYFSLNTSKNYATTPAALGTVASTLSTTGIVKAATETQLAFPMGGRVASISVKVGSTVYQGQTLASLDSSQAQGAVESAQGAYEAAQANYALLLNGASSSDVSIAQLNYNSTVSEEKLAVANALQKLLSTDLIPTTTSTTVSTATPIISGSYTGTAQGTISITVNPTGNGGYFSTTGLVTTTGTINASIPQPIGSTGLFILFPSGAASSPVTWNITIPNTAGPNYTADNAAYQAALQSQTDKVAAAQAALDKVQAAPRSEDVTVAQAQVSSAKGALDTAQAALANDFITAPINGTITSVADISAGSIVSANTPVIGIMSSGAFQIESYVSEKDLSLVTVGEPVTITTDAYGPNVVWKGTVIEVAPAATTQADGQLGYKVTYQFNETDPRIKSGISANVTIIGSTEDNVLEVPSTAVFLKNGQSFVLVKNGKTTEDRAVTVGLVGANGTEITSGLSAGEQVVTLGNN